MEMSENYLELILAKNSDEEPSCISRRSHNFSCVANKYSSKYCMHAQACKITICNAGANVHYYYNQDYKILVKTIALPAVPVPTPCVIVSPTYHA